MQLVQLLYPSLLAGANVAAGLLLYAVFDTVLGGVMLAVGVLVVVAAVHEALRQAGQWLRVTSTDAHVAE
jgi:hypothetical protein